MQRTSFKLLFICILGLILSLLVGDSSGGDVSNNARPSSKFPDLYEATLAELQEGMEKGHFTSVDLVKVSLLVSSLASVVLSYAHRPTSLGLTK
jgi:amidase